MPELQPALKKALETIYLALAEEQAQLGIPCHRCGRCCNFSDYDHQLWATTIELAYLIETAGQKSIVHDGICPYLHQHQCTARDGRMLGCRIFLCEMNAVQMEQLHEKYIAQIQQLASEFDIEMEYDELISSLKRLTAG
ncbi:MAG: hypothetical protein JXX29_16710 [Deltaproteobacteria bacterium]|nr:hypothetical protein [Deltaproteobacteria bacterium]MBN2673327.1 hypothetical protein [Deltaproteobacteria bacterium]